MMNSTNRLSQVKPLIDQTVKPILFEEIDPYQSALEIDEKEVLLLLSVLKHAGFTQLSYLSAIDWPDEQKFELVYVLMNWEIGYHLQIRTKINRENPVMPTILSIFPGAKYYERECHEFFGIKFPGNPDYEKQLILENWDDLPPLRKDFDPKAYSDKKFAQRTYSETYIVSDDKNKQKVKREQRKERAKHLRGEDA